MTTSDGWWPALPGWTGPRINLRHHPTLEQAALALLRLSKSEAGALVLSGNPGCGKTELAEILLHSVGGTYRTTNWATLETEWSAVRYAEPVLLDDIKASYGHDDGPRQILDKCLSARLLILDDIGAGYVRENSAEWYDSLLWRLLDGRQHKKTLITTNLRSEELRQRVGYRCADRLKEMMAANTARGRDNWIDLFDVPSYRARSW